MLFASNMEDDEIFIFNDARSAFDFRRVSCKKIDHFLFGLCANKYHYDFKLMLLQQLWIGKP